MQYTVINKTAELDANGSSYALRLDSRNPSYQHTILAVTKEDFDAVEVGSKISIGIHVSMVPKGQDEAIADEFHATIASALEFNQIPAYDPSI
jgi:hypothetical protein